MYCYRIHSFYVILYTNRINISLYQIFGIIQYLLWVWIGKLGVFCNKRKKYLVFINFFLFAKMYINLKITHKSFNRIKWFFCVWSILTYKLNHACFFNGIPLIQFKYTPSPLPKHTHRRTHTRSIQELFLLEHDFTYHCGIWAIHTV